MIELILYILLFATGYGFYLGRKEEIDSLVVILQKAIDKLFS